MPRRALPALLLLGLALPGAPAAGDDPAPLATFENAAYDYWRACALAQDVTTAEEADILAFSRQDLPALPPRAFVYRPGAGRWLLNEGLMLEALHEGAAKARCVFLRPGGETVERILLYRRAMTRMMQRALASAKAHEFVDNRRATASIYADLLRSLRHLDEGGDWAAVDFTLQRLPAILGDIEGFLTRQPPRDALELIVRELEAAPRPRFPLPRMLAREAETYAAFLLQDPEQLEARIAGLYGDTVVKPALDELLRLDPPDRPARVRQWVDGYRELMDELADAVARPYEDGIRAVREIDGRVAGVVRRDGAGPANPLLSALMPPMEETYQRFVAAEAHLAMVEVLCKGGIYRDFVSAWPDTLDILAQFAGGTLPPDPFTGQPMEYDIRGALPRVRVDAPRSVREGEAVTEINLRLRLEQDEEALASLVRELQRRERMEASAARERETAADREEEEETRSRRPRAGRGLAY